MIEMLQAKEQDLAAKKFGLSCKIMVNPSCPRCEGGGIVVRYRKDDPFGGGSLQPVFSPLVCECVSIEFIL